MNRREFLAISSTSSLGMLAGGQILALRGASGAGSGNVGSLKLLPYPQELAPVEGILRLGQPEFISVGAPSRTEQIAMDCLRRFLPRQGRRIVVRLGSLEEGYDRSWLSNDEAEFLASEKSSPEASILRITPRDIVAVGRGKWGMLWAIQTINQVILESRRLGQSSIPCLRIKDWPDMRWRCLAPTLTWYSGWNRLEGYDLCNWSEGEWKWLADWSMLHKCNGWAVCMYGYWPFRLPGYEKETLNLDSWRFNPRTKQKELRRFTHRNIAQEFYPEVIRYANERGIKVYAYIGKNSFNGCDFRNNPEIYAGGAAEMLPFAPGVAEVPGMHSLAGFWSWASTDLSLRIRRRIMSQTKTSNATRRSGNPGNPPTASPQFNRQTGTIRRWGCTLSITRGCFVNSTGRFRSRVSGFGARPRSI